MLIIGSTNKSERKTLYRVVSRFSKSFYVDAISDDRQPPESSDERQSNYLERKIAHEVGHGRQKQQHTESGWIEKEERDDSKRKREGKLRTKTISNLESWVDEEEVERGGKKTAEKKHSESHIMTEENILIHRIIAALVE